MALFGNTLQVALADPTNPAVIDELGYVVGKEIQVVVADPAQIEQAIGKAYADTGGESVSDVLKELGADTEIAKEVESIAKGGLTSIEEVANDTPIVKFVSLVLQQAIQDRASDIHFEPFEDEFKIRYRVDGALYEMAPPPKHLALPVTSRIKVMANLDISERRLPQDGRIATTIAGRRIDLRVSTLPTQFGESVVLRVLDQSSVNLEVENLGLPKTVSDYVTEAIQQPNGIIIVTGPTGLRQDDDALRLSAAHQFDRFQAPHRGGPGGVRHRRHHAGGDPRVGGHDLRQGPALVPPARPGRHHGGRNARSGDLPDRDSGLADGAFGAEHAPHQRLPPER